MSEQPNQEQPGAQASGSRSIVPSTSVGAAPPAIMSLEDAGRFDPETVSADAPLTAVSASALIRSKWLILGVFLLLSAATLPWIWLFVKPTYQATASVRVTPVVLRLVFDTEENSLPRLFSMYLNTQASRITNPTVLQRVLERDEVQRTKWFDARPRTWRTLLGSPPPSHLERLKAALTVKRRPNTELIDVSMVTAEPGDAPVIVNAVLDDYMRYCEQATDELKERRFRTLRAERKDLDGRIQSLVEHQGELSKQLGVDDPDIVRAQLVAQLGELDMERKRLDRTYQLTQGALEKRRSTEGEGDDGADEAPGDPNLRYAADAEWMRLNHALETSGHELEMARSRYGESHPRIKELQLSVAHAERLLRQREAQLGPEWWGGFDRTAPDAEGSLLSLDPATLASGAKKQRRELELLDEQIGALKSEQARTGELAKRIAQVSDDFRRKRALYDEVYDRLQVLEMEEKAPGRISVAARAVATSRPHRDRRFLLTVMALGGAMMTALAVAYLRTSTNPKIREAGDVRHTVRVPFLGQVPPLPASKGLGADCSPAVMESMRMVRTALLERLNGTDDHVVLITSSSRQAGKTNVAIGLAKSLAYLGKKTLLVEADLRKPALAERLGVETDVGLAALLSGAANDDQVIVPGDIPQLDVLPAGKQPMDFDAEFLANGVFAACLARWKKSYDFVLLDSPPVLPVADARILASQADGTIMVLRALHCRRTDVIQAYADLSAAGGTLLGTVLVGVRSKGEYDFHEDYHADHAADSDTSRALRA